LTKWFDKLGSCSYSGDIVLIYVATSTTIDVEKFRECVDYCYKKSPALNNYTGKVSFCYVDRGNSALIWGEAFDKLITLMKGLED
jgi:hypothetical protein